MQTKAFTTELRTVNENTREITFTASTETPDRYSDVIRVKGWQLDNFRKNPVILFNHKSSELPIGRCTRIWTEQSPPALVQTIKFADAATYPFADVVWNLCRQGFLNAVSVGFLPLEMEPLSDLEGRNIGTEFLSQELLECSLVPLPANPDCLARARTKGFSEEDLARAFSGEADVPPTAESELAAINKEILDIAAVVLHADNVADARRALDNLKSFAIRPKQPTQTTDEITTIDSLISRFVDVEAE